MLALLGVLLLVDVDVKKDQVAEQLLHGWQAYSQRVGQLQGITGFTFEGTVPPAKSSGGTEFKRNGVCRMLRTLSKGKTGRLNESVLVANGRYAFKVARQLKGCAGPWQLVEQKESSAYDGEFDHYAQSVLDCLRVFNAYLPTLAKENKLHVTEAKRDAASGLINVDFTTDDPAFKGVLSCDPVHDWIPRFFTAQREGRADNPSSVTTFTVEHHDNSTVVIRKAKLVTDLYFHDGKHNRQTLVLTNDLAEPKALPDEHEFTLAAFGFPEPMPPRRATPILAWVMLLGIGLVLAGLVLRRVWRRRVAMEG